jgi:hypothetical protein
MSIQDFPLAWRWTQRSHSVLPPEVLKDIRPLSAAEAAGLGTAAASSRKSPVSHAASNTETEEVSRWLRCVQPNLQARVYVSWTKELAVETTWDIFTDYWDDFCYPSSDDVTVVPVVGAWQLIYQHYEQFNFFASP